MVEWWKTLTPKQIKEEARFAPGRVEYKEPPTVEQTRKVLKALVEAGKETVRPFVPVVKKFVKPPTVAPTPVVIPTPTITPPPEITPALMPPPKRLATPIPGIHVPGLGLPTPPAVMERRYAGMPPPEVLPPPTKPWERLGISKDVYLRRYVQNVIGRGGGEYIKRVYRSSPATARKMTNATIEYWKTEPTHLKALNKELEPDLASLKQSEGELTRVKDALIGTMAQGLISTGALGLRSGQEKRAQDIANAILKGEMKPYREWLPEGEWKKVETLIGKHNDLQEGYAAKLSEVIPKVGEYEGRYNQFVTISKEVEPGVFQISPKVQEIAAKLTPGQSFVSWMEIPAYGALGVFLGAGIGAGLATLKVVLGTKLAAAATRIPLAAKVIAPVTKVVSPVARTIFRPAVMYPAIGTYEAYKAYQMYEAGTPLSEIARALGKDIAFIAGFGWGFGKAIKGIRVPSKQRPKIQQLEAVKTETKMRLGPEEEFRVIGKTLYKTGKTVQMGDPIFYKKMPWASIRFEVSGRPVTAGVDVVPFAEPARYYGLRGMGKVGGIKTYIPAEQIVFSKGQLFVTTGIRSIETTVRIGALEVPVFRRGLAAREEVATWIKYAPKMPTEPTAPYRVGLGKEYWAKFDKWYQELATGKTTRDIFGGVAYRQRLLIPPKVGVVPPTPITAPVRLYIPVVEPSLMAGVGSALSALSSVLLGTKQVTRLRTAQRLGALRASSQKLRQSLAQTVRQNQRLAQAQAQKQALALAQAQKQAQLQILQVMQPTPIQPIPRIPVAPPFVPPYLPEVRETRRMARLRRARELAEIRRKRYFPVGLPFVGRGAHGDPWGALRMVFGAPTPARLRGNRRKK